MKRIAVKANALGVSLPVDFANDAKATQKRREKQDAYCKAKAAGGAVEEEAPAEEEEAAPPAEEEEAAPAEE